MWRRPLPTPDKAGVLVQEAISLSPNFEGLAQIQPVLDLLLGASREFLFRIRRDHTGVLNSLQRSGRWPLTSFAMPTLLSVLIKGRSTFGSVATTTVSRHALLTTASPTWHSARRADLLRRRAAWRLAGVRPWPGDGPGSTRPDYATTVRSPEQTAGVSSSGFLLSTSWESAKKLRASAKLGGQPVATGNLRTSWRQRIGTNTVCRDYRPIDTKPPPAYSTLVEEAPGRTQNATATPSAATQRTCSLSRPARVCQFYFPRR